MIDIRDGLGAKLQINNSTINSISTTLSDGMFMLMIIFRCCFESQVATRWVHKLFDRGDFSE